MALRGKTFTLNGSQQSLADLDSSNNVIHRPINVLRIQSEASNAAVSVTGNKRAVTATDYDFQVLADTSTISNSVTIGAGVSGCPFNLEDINVIGTNTQKIHISYVTI